MFKNKWKWEKVKYKTKMNIKVSRCIKIIEEIREVIKELISKGYLTMTNQKIHSNV